MNLKCPKCGYVHQVGDQTSMEACPKCGIVYAKYEKILEQKRAKAQEIPPTQTATNPQPPATKGKTLINPMLVISVVAALVLSFAGYNLFQRIQTQRANKEFSIMVDSVSLSLIMLAADAEKLVNEIQGTWHDAIFNQRRNFNSALAGLREQRSNEIQDLKYKTAEIASKLKRMNPPSAKEADYKRLKELYLTINQYAEMALYPTGSLQSYAEQNNKLNIQVRSAIRELELMR